MPKPKPLTRAKFLGHLRVAIRRVYNHAAAVFKETGGRVSDPAFRRLHGIKESLFMVQRLVLGHVAQWYEYLDETLGDNTHG
jgi:hypothetical protein